MGVNYNCKDNIFVIFNFLGFIGCKIFHVSNFRVHLPPCIKNSK